MKRLITTLLLAAFVSFGFGMALPTGSYADSLSAAKDQACAGLGTADGSGKCAANSDSGVSSIVSAAVQILSVIIGIAAVIMIIYSGFKYITSGGDASKVGAAKNSLVYALIGLAIVVLAQVMVHLVIGGANNAITP